MPDQPSPSLEPVKCKKRTCSSLEDQRPSQLVHPSTVGSQLPSLPSPIRSPKRRKTSPQIHRPVRPLKSLVGLDQATVEELGNPEMLARESPSIAEDHPSRRARLTRRNLQSLQSRPSNRCSGWDPIQELAEPSLIDRAATPPSTHLGKMEDSEAMSIKSTQTGKSRKTEKSGKSGKSGLTKNPFGYSVLMAVNFGVMLYNYFPGEETEKAEKLDLVACDLPSNVKTIIEALGSYRDDLPTRKAFQRYCVVAAQLASAPKESEVEKLFAQFLDPSSRDDANHIHGRRNLVTSPGMLPLDQTKVMPDMCAGIKPFHLKGRTWVGKYLEGIVANKTMIIVNGIVEYKSSEGSISAARIQNQAAAYLACLAWQRDTEQLELIRSLTSSATKDEAINESINLIDQQLPTNTAETEQSSTNVGKKSDIGEACVGSICFNGDILEASVHWLVKLTDDDRPYNIHSLRVATGFAFAATLAEHQATYKKFANFLDWMLGVRQDRLELIGKLPKREPEVVVAKVTPATNFTDAQDETQDGDGEEDGDEEEEEDGDEVVIEVGTGPNVRPDRSFAGDSTSNTQPMQQMSLQSLDGAVNTPETSAGPSAPTRASQADPETSKRRKKAGMADAVASVAHKAGGKLKT